MWAPVFLFIMGCRLKIEGLDNIEKDKHYVIMANHCSYLDIAILFKVMPFNIHFIGKKELKKVPFLGWYMAISGMIFIDRSNPIKARKSIDDAVRLVKKGFNVVIFPEGTTSETGEIAAFKKGGFVMARESKSPILPVRIFDSNIVWPTNPYKLKPHKVVVKIGESLEHSDYAHKNIRENMVDIREVIVSLDSNKNKAPTK